MGRALRPGGAGSLVRDRRRARAHARGRSWGQDRRPHGRAPLARRRASRRRPARRVAAGFAAYAAWRFANAFFDRDNEGDDAKGLGKRAGDFAKGVFYLALAFTVVRILFGADEGGEKDTDQKAAGVLGWPLGRELIFAAALGVAGAAVWNVYRGVSRKFEDDLEVGTSHAVRCWIGRIGLVGLVARGVAFAIIAWFLAKAAWEFDPKEAVSLGGALAKLASVTWGHVLLALVAAGLLAFGLFGLAQARWRDV